jgi:hypothetical protein
MEKQRKVIRFGIDDEGTLGVDAISLVDIPAIGENWIALKSHEVKLSAIDEERRIVYGAVLIPDKEIYRVDEKTGEEYYIVFPKEVVMRAAHQYLIDGNQGNATVMHERVVGGVSVVESWLKEGESDKSIALGLNPDLPAFTWFVGQRIDNDEMWEKVKAGEVKAFSIEGRFAQLDELMMEAQVLTEIEEAIKSSGNE